MWDAESDIKITDAHELVVLLWIYNIVAIRWGYTLIKINIETKAKRYIHCSFENKAVCTVVQMNYNNDNCWTNIL